MNSLPCEIIHEILSHVPLSSLPSARLTSRLFNAVLAPHAFPSIPLFINPETALATLESGAREARKRQVTSLWSPRCSVPDDVPIPASFLLAAHLALRGRQWRPAFVEGKESREWDSDSGVCLSEDDGDVAADRHALTVDELLGGLGCDNIDEETLRAAMFRYALYLSYSYRGPGKAPSLWIFEPQTWENRT